jgi:hypothetical protein
MESRDCGYERAILKYCGYLLPILKIYRSKSGDFASIAINENGIFGGVFPQKYAFSLCA